jgi:DNA (cytosine-5)-methyltransferase 1
MQVSEQLQQEKLSTDQAARALGISKSTLLRWFRDGRIAEVGRDRNNWRVFTAHDIERIRKAL